MAQEKQEKQEKPEKKDGDKAAAKKPAFLENKVLLLGGVVVLQALLAIGITQFVIVPRLGQGAASVAGENAEAPEEHATTHGILVSLEEIIASLRSEGSGKSYVKTSISVEVTDHAMELLVGERLAQLRDSVIMTVSQRTAAELTTPEGTKALREDLTERLAEHLPEGALLNIYFSDLVIQ